MFAEVVALALVVTRSLFPAPEPSTVERIGSFLTHASGES